MVNAMPGTWYTKTQPTVVLLTDEAEYITAVIATKDYLWMR